MRSVFLPKTDSYKVTDEEIRAGRVRRRKWKWNYRRAWDHLLTAVAVGSFGVICWMMFLEITGR